MVVSAPDLETLEAADGTTLVLYRWGRKPGVGTAILVHGLGEHAGRYGQVAERLGGLGWEVVGYDHRGHGRSGGDRGRLRRDDDLIRDLTAVVDRVGADALPGPAARGGAESGAGGSAGEDAGGDAGSGASRPPLLLLGHSMGGVVAARFVAEAVRPVELLVLSSPALDAGLSAPRRLLVRLARRFAPDLVMGNGLDPSGISRDPEEVRAYREDPLVHDRISPRLASFVMEGGPRVLKEAPNWSVPTLLLWAGDDVFVGPEGSAALARTAPAGVVSAHRFPEHRHELFNEVDREAVFDVLEGWLRRMTPGAGDSAG